MHPREWEAHTEAISLFVPDSTENALEGKLSPTTRRASIGRLPGVLELRQNRIAIC